MALSETKALQFGKAVPVSSPFLIALKIQCLMELTNYSLRKLSSDSGIEITRLSRLLDGSQSPTLDSLEKIADLLNVAVSWLVEKSPLFYLIKGNVEDNLKVHQTTPKKKP